ncbi:hypothetical protein [Streptomyces sp. NPDC060194]|uniref:hypothetical protein n=1 Tax=Streptomyces sp. NPDC060194 TaxID=3347069 RepID=UPI00365B784A
MYESHLTAPCAPAELGRLERWAARHGVKFTHIELARGRTPSQPMLTSAGSRPTYDAERGHVTALAALLAADGFAVARTKVECVPWAPEVPRDDAEAVADVRGRHFEHHVKLLLDPSHDTSALLAAAVRHGAHVPRNARRRRPDGQEERFVTQRCHGVGDDRAAGALQRLLAELAAYEVLDVEREYVLLDSGPELDHGWLEAA